MGIASVKTKLLAYAIGATFGGMSGAFLGSYNTVVSGDDFQFGFSVLILSMVIVGGIGSISGVVLGGLLLGYINYWLLPKVLNNVPSHLGLNFQLTDVEFGVYGFLLVLVMLLRPQGLFPERRRRLEITGEIAAEDAQLVETGPVTGA
jgi:branched-chain amino acid transport system permease protein